MAKDIKAEAKPATKKLKVENVPQKNKILRNGPNEFPWVGVMIS